MRWGYGVGSPDLWLQAAGPETRRGVYVCANAVSPPPTLAGVVDAVLIPEVPFTMKGDHGLFKYLEGVLERKGHCVVCVAEGAGQVRVARNTQPRRGCNGRALQLAQASLQAACPAPGAC